MPAPTTPGPMSAPPASVPLAFLSAAGVGYVATGAAVAFAADRLAATPTHSGAVSAVHVGLLAFLTTAVLGAVHQFGPVVAQRRMRSTSAARVTLALLVGAVWLLPTGFAHGPEDLIVAGGLMGLAAVLLAIWNLWPALASPDGGVPLVALRLALGYLLVTVCFGVVYAFDRQTGWFPLLPHRTLAHAHLGLVGWMGLAYVGVAEKLWPMFLLAHRPSQRSGSWAVGLVGSGTAVLAAGILFALPPVAVVGGAVVSAGMVAHLVSLASCVRHRRRPLELLHAYLFASAAFLVAAIVLGAVGALADVATSIRTHLLAAEVASLAAWLAIAVVGHLHKIVPFITYTALRARGVRQNASGGPLMFGDLFDRRAGWVSLVGVVSGFTTLVVGLALGEANVIAAAGAIVSLSAVVTIVNLVGGPWRASKVEATPKPTIPVTPWTPVAETTGA